METQSTMLMLKRQGSTSSLLLLDPDLDSGDVFDPPAWRPGRFLQFADISLEDEPGVRPVSLSTQRALPGGSDDEQCSKEADSFLVQVRGRSLFILSSLVFDSDDEQCSKEAADSFLVQVS